MQVKIFTVMGFYKELLASELSLKTKAKKQKHTHN